MRVHFSILVFPAHHTYYMHRFIDQVDINWEINKIQVYEGRGGIMIVEGLSPSLHLVAFYIKWLDSYPSIR